MIFCTWYQERSQIHEVGPIRKGYIGEEEGKNFWKIRGKKCMEQEMIENLSIPQLKPTVKAAASQDRGTETPCAVWIKEVMTLAFVSSHS